MEWLEGTGITFPKKIDAWFVTELIRPKMNYLLMVARSGSEFYYSLRYWSPEGTPWTKPQLIKDRDFMGRIQALISQRDKFPQAFAQRDDFHIDAFYVDADDLPEIKEIEGEEIPP